MLAGIVLDEEVGDGGAGDDEGGGTEDGEEEYSGWADMGGHWVFFAFRFWGGEEGGGWSDDGFWERGGRIAAMGWLIATGLNAGVGALCGERERDRSQYGRNCVVGFEEWKRRGKTQQRKIKQPA